MEAVDYLLSLSDEDLLHLAAGVGHEAMDAAYDLIEVRALPVEPGEPAPGRYTAQLLVDILVEANLALLS